MPVGDTCRWPSTSCPQEGSCGLRLGKELIRTGRVEQFRKRVIVHEEEYGWSVLRSRAGGKRRVRTI